ncbi:MAG: ABC-type transporter, periplasmic subunit [Frankiales bacterium]|nr:ABC-type transporter, periplasmic subunit [Frankiales bacterium]
MPNERPAPTALPVAESSSAPSSPRRRPSRRNFLAGVGGVSLASVLAACTPGAKSTSGSGGGAKANILVIAMTASDIPLLDTGLAQNQGYEGLRFVANQLFDGLTKFDLKQGEKIPPVIPGLALSWTANAAATVWTFKLRPNVKFTDGTPWNADAAIFNFNRYINKSAPEFYPALNAAAGLTISSLKSSKKIDDMTIEVTTNGPLAYLPSNLTTVYFASPTAVKAEGNEGFGAKPVGTGPFTFVSMTRGQQLVLKANPDYWGGAPKVEQVILRPIPDPTARIAALRSGQVNWAEVPPPDDVPTLTKDGFQVLTNSYDHVWPWVINGQKKPFTDVRVRQAMNYAINREALIKNVLQGTADPEFQAAARANAAYREENNLYSYDPAKAKSLLAAAGLPNGFSTTLSYPTSGSGNMVPTPMNEALQQDLAAVGIKVKLQPVEWASMLTDYFVGKIPGNADMINISLSMQQEGFWNTWFGAGSGPNVGKYNNPKVQALFTQAAATLDDTKRSDLYAQAVKYITEDAPWVFIVDDRNPRVLAANVKGFIEPKSWFADLTTLSVS